MRKAISLEGLSICPEAAVCLGALESLLARGEVCEELHTHPP